MGVIEGPVRLGSVNLRQVENEVGPMKGWLVLTRPTVGLGPRWRSI